MHHRQPDHLTGNHNAVQPGHQAAERDLGTLVHYYEFNQVKNNTEEQAMLGDFDAAMDDAILDSAAAHENQKLQLLSDADKHQRFQKLLYAMVKNRVDELTDSTLKLCFTCNY